MVIWHILDENEASQNKDNFEKEYEMRGTLSHPITFRPYAMYQHKQEKSQVYLVPMQLTDVDEQ
jgi:hypothetical protein